jgi:hypothetical protein
MVGISSRSCRSRRPDVSNTTALAISRIFCGGGAVKVSWLSDCVFEAYHNPAFVNMAEDDHRSPGHQVDGGSRAEILVGRSATRWLRL